MKSVERSGTVWSVTTAESHRHDELATKADLHALEDRIDLRFDLIDHRFDLVDQRFEMVDQRFEQVDQRFNDLNPSIQAIGSRVESVSTYLNRVVLALITLLGASVVVLLVQAVD